MFSSALDITPPPPRPRAGLRRGGPILLRDVMPAALEQVLGGERPCGGSPGDGAPSRPGRPPFPRAA